ncbi:MAG: RNase P modulator RnpM [Bacilli bacterium]
MKKIPLRRCVVTKEQMPKSELLRIVRDKENNVFVDQTGKAGGRGAYIKKDLNVLNTARSKKILEKNLETSIKDELYEEIEQIIKNN